MSPTVIRSVRPLSRRRLLQSAGQTAFFALCGGLAPRVAGASAERRLVARDGRARLTGDDYPDTAVWCYDGQVPGPLLRARQGDRLRVVAENRLEVETTIHWHGLRVPNAMDGVPDLTQAPIAPGESFVYDFDLHDAGSYWYHPHLGSPEQVDRGLYGAIIVDEKEPPPVDRDVLWVLDDWRLTEDAQISDDFGNWHDLSHAGRLGNSMTVNGRPPQDLALRAGERIRLRLVNCANARSVALAFEGHEPWVVALDGQPVAPHPPEGGRIVLAPAQRADVILDAEGKPGQSSRIVDSYYPQDVFHLANLVYADIPPLRESPLDATKALPPNPLAEPDLTAAERLSVEFGGGMMDPKLRRGEVTVEAVRARFNEGGIWTVNGMPHLAHGQAPLFRLTRGRSYVLALTNDTVWDHPIHLHGHSFRVLSRNGVARPQREWRDTVLLQPGDSAELAFVADNPGDWMFHCHILEHQASGMMATISVA